MFDWLLGRHVKKEKEKGEGDILYERDRRRISQTVEAMGRRTCLSLTNAMDALKERNADLALSVVEMDDEIDDMDVQIDRECLCSIAMRQPVREELRFVFAVIKISTDLERIGDQACNVAQRAIHLSKKPELKPLEDIPRMTDIAVSMVNDSLESFLNKDVRLARDVFIRDRDLDKLAYDLSRELVLIMGDLPSGSIEKVAVASDLILVARYLERIGDHACNIAERGYFAVTGERLKETLDAENRGSEEKS